jgi:iron(III) transport system ATP-binding protein
MLEINNLYLSYRSESTSVLAVKDVSFKLNPGEFYTLLGPSGCGKTSTLRSVAGLESPDQGTIEIAGKIAYSSTNKVNVPANKRDYGMVFQSYAIWPHMSVLDNVLFPLIHGRLKIKKEEARSRAMNALNMVQLEQYAHRPAPFLSGGQQQRVALARALALEPAVLLLDEPLSNLDAKLREEMRNEIKSLVRRTGTTTLYVTHDQIEALAMSDRVAVMFGGEIVQEGTPWEVYSSPRTSFVAQFLGKANLLEGTLVDHGSEGLLGAVETHHGNLRCFVPEEANGNSRVVVSCRPESVVLHIDRPPQRDNVLGGRITERTFLGDAVEYVVAVGDDLMTAKANGVSDLDLGLEVHVELPMEHCRAILF